MSVMTLPREPVLPANLSEAELQEIERAVFAECHPQKSDVLFFFGYIDPDPAFILNLAQGDWAPWILLTGNHAAERPDGSLVEAQNCHRILVEGGVDRRRILMEDRSTNTGDNVIFGKEVLQERGIEPKSILAVCKSHHTGRGLRTLAKHFPGVQLSCVAWDPVYEGVTVSKANWREHPVSQGRVYGEFLRMQEYKERGFIV